MNNFFFADKSPGAQQNWNFPFQCQSTAPWTLGCHINTWEVQYFAGRKQINPHPSADPTCQPVASGSPQPCANTVPPLAPLRPGRGPRSRFQDGCSRGVTGSVLYRRQGAAPGGAGAGRTARADSTIITLTKQRTGGLVVIGSPGCGTP